MGFSLEKKAALSAQLRENVLSKDDGLIKSAATASNDYFRVEIRENGIRRQITPPEAITAADFDKSENTDFPIKYIEVAPQSLGAYTVSFETGPKGDNIMARRTRAEFGRLMTPKYSIDEIRLLTYDMPLIDIWEDLMLKDIMDTEDTVWQNVDKVICGTLNTPVASMGMCRYCDIGPMSRSSLTLLKQGMSYTQAGPLGQGLIPQKYVMNQLTYAKFANFNRNEIGGDLAQDLFVDGVNLSKVSGVDMVVTTKRDIIGTDEVFIYTDPQFYGKFYTYEDVTMVTDKKDGYWLSFHMYETIGGAIGNIAGVLRAKFGTGAAHDWVTGA